MHSLHNSILQHGFETTLSGMVSSKLSLSKGAEFYTDVCGLVFLTAEGKHFLGSRRAGVLHFMCAHRQQLPVCRHHMSAPCCTMRVLDVSADPGCVGWL